MNFYTLFFSNLASILINNNNATSYEYNNDNFYGLQGATENIFYGLDVY